MNQDSNKRSSSQSIITITDDLTFGGEYHCFSHSVQNVEISEDQNSGQKELNIDSQNDLTLSPVREDINNTKTDGTELYIIPEEIEDSNLHAEYASLSPPINSFAADEDLSIPDFVCTESNFDWSNGNNASVHPLLDNISDTAYISTEDGITASDFSQKKEKTWYLDVGEPTDLIN
ncbi:17825_t:CDS:1, partial [Acaulospora morrowiae]